MGLFTNIGGQLKELTSISTNVGGQLKELTSLSSNIGGQLKEIYTSLPKNITGTWHLTSGISSSSNKTLVTRLKIPSNRRLKVKITITITDRFCYRDWGDGEEIWDEAKVLFVKSSLGSESTVLECNLKNSSYKETYTAETTFIANAEEYIIYANRWVAWFKRSDYSLDYYANSLLYFNYSIEFERV